MTTRSDLAGFLSSLAELQPPNLDQLTTAASADAWSGIDCLSCARCCRSMMPRFTSSDIKRIAIHFRITSSAVKSRWLTQDKDGSWMGRSKPCAFLNLQTNKCSIYAIRPADCSGFPHLSATPAASYLDMHRQNMKYCPATLNMVKLLEQKMLEDPR
ncbi:MAG TPA: YkgJ family cysteine cluster protein [Flavisolibacter sp.]|nr:YkgJ family cysteine cluster protein [Flavisolibacter sp.]